MLTETERDLLVRARKIVAAEGGMDTPICIAIDIAKWDNWPQYNAAANELKKSISRSLGASAYLKGWVQKRLEMFLDWTMPDNAQKLCTTRLAWIDYMLTNW